MRIARDALARRSAQVRQARAGLISFFFLLLAGSLPLYSVILSERHASRRFVLIALLFLLPALASAGARLRWGENFDDVSFRFDWSNGLRPLCFALLFPLAVASLAYGAGWSLGLAHFAPPALNGIRVDGLGGGPQVRFGVLLLVAMTLGTVIGLPLAAGQEIGWRGYVLIRMSQIGVRRPGLVTGVLWSLWLTPLAVAGDIAPNPHRVTGAAVFILVLLAFSLVAARLRFASGSIWPSTVLHATWNATVGGSFAAATVEKNAWVGESGVLVLLVSACLAVLLLRNRRLLGADPPPSVSTGRAG